MQLNLIIIKRRENGIICSCNFYRILISNDFDVLEDEKQAVRSFYKIKKDFDKDKFASEMILQKLIFEDKFNYKRFNYKDLV